MNIVFMGTPEFAALSLKSLLNSRHRVKAVVTVPDKAQGRGKKIKPSKVKELALEKNLQLLQPESLKDPEFINDLKTIKADVFVVVAFRILPRQVFTIPPKGTINAHASLLPKYRGAAPINWALINGEKTSGVTTMIIDEKVDTGALLMQEKVQIDLQMNAGILHDKLALLAARLLVESLDGIEKNQIKPYSQDNRFATKAPKIFKETCRINFNQEASKVHDFIRGLSPYPGAYTFYRGKMLKILVSKEVLKTENENIAPGTIVNFDKQKITVSCKNSLIEISEVQLQGKKRMTVRDFLNGNNIEIMEKFS